MLAGIYNDKTDEKLKEQALKESEQDSEQYLKIHRTYYISWISRPINVIILACCCQCDRL